MASRTVADRWKREVALGAQGGLADLGVVGLGRAARQPHVVDPQGRRRADDRADVEGALHVVEHEGEPALRAPAPLAVEPLHPGAVELLHLRRHLQEAVAGSRAESGRVPTLRGEPRLEGVGCRGASAPPARRGRRVGAARARSSSRACSAGLPMRIGGFDQRRSTARSSGTASGSTAVTFVSPSRGGVPATEVEGPPVDVDGPHRGRGGTGREGAGDRAVPAAEVDEGAAGARRRAPRGGGTWCPGPPGRPRTRRGRWRG